MNDQQSPDFGKQISQIVQDALNSKDFTQLKSTIDVTVREIKQSISNIPQPPRADSRRQRQYQWQYQRVYQPPRPQQQYQPPQNAGRQPQGRPVYVQPGAYVYPKPPQKVPGRVASVLWATFGMIGAIPLGIASLVLAILVLAGSGGILPLAICGGLFAVTLGMTLGGFGMRKKLKRFRRYQQIIGQNRYYPLEQLAAATAQSKSELCKDLRMMIRRGLFREAYIDEQETTLMLDRETYAQYLTLKQQHRQQEIQAAAPPPQKADEGARTLVDEGRDTIRKIKAANDAIPGEEISGKLLRLEQVTAQIFDYVEKHPAKQSEIRKFMNYYLPTTLKLVDAYREYDSKPLQTESVTNAKHEIESILDTINGAFENLLEELYQDDLLDITTDISALGTILAQDGLTNSDLKSAPFPPKE